MNCNQGVCFLSFSDNDSKNLFKSQWSSQVNALEAAELKDWANSLKIKDIPMSSDVIWDNLGKSKGTAICKRVLFFILITIVSIILLTPTYALQLVDTLNALNVSKFGVFVLNFI